MRILLVEDHRGLGASLRQGLQGEGYSIDWVCTLGEARAALSAARYALLLLDLTLPDGSGLDFLKEIRREGRSLPVLVLTARGGLNDRIDGLDGGADDYLVKPFAVRELFSRCRALLRRPSVMASDVLQLSNLTLDRSSAEVRINGALASLARREYQLLDALLRRADGVSTRAYLENELYDFDSEPSQNAIEASVSRLRAALQSYGADVEIRTIRGVGYRVYPLEAGA